MSAGLGPTQLRALAILGAPRQHGMTAPELAAALGVTERFARTVADSLVDRRLVYRRDDEGILQWWTPERWRRHRLALAEIAAFKKFLATMHERPTICPHCGNEVPK